MKVVFIVFSPSGHTLIAAQKFMHLLEDKGISCHMINITKNVTYLRCYGEFHVGDPHTYELVIPIWKYPVTVGAEYVRAPAFNVHRVRVTTIDKLIEIILAHWEYSFHFLVYTLTSETL